MRSSDQQSVQIRHATAKDLDILAGCAEEFLSTIGLSATACDARRVFEQVLTRPDLGTVLVAEHKRGICGYAYAAFHWKSEFGGEFMDVVELFVEQAWRNRGVGRALMKSLLDIAQRRTIRRVSAEVHPGNAAIERILESSGFDPQRRTLWGLRLF